MFTNSFHRHCNKINTKDLNKQNKTKDKHKKIGNKRNDYFIEIDDIKSNLQLQPLKHLHHEEQNEKINFNICTQKKQKLAHIKTTMLKKNPKVRKEKKKFKNHEKVPINILLKT